MFCSQSAGFRRRLNEFFLVKEPPWIVTFIILPLYLASIRSPQYITGQGIERGDRRILGFSRFSVNNKKRIVLYAFPADGQPGEFEHLVTKQFTFGFSHSSLHRMAEAFMISFFK